MVFRGGVWGSRMELELGFAKMPHCQGLAVGVALDLVSRLFPNPHWFDDNTPHTAPLTHASDFGVVEPVVYSEFYTPPTPHTHTHIHMETQLLQRKQPHICALNLSDGWGRPL